MEVLNHDTCHDPMDSAFPHYKDAGRLKNVGIPTIDMWHEFWWHSEVAPDDVAGVRLIGDYHVAVGQT